MRRSRFVSTAGGSGPGRASEKNFMKSFLARGKKNQ
jgi:hypothetical protein